MLKKIKETSNFIKSKIDSRPKIAIILGTGLGSLADMVEDQTVFPFKNIPHFKTSTAPSHVGRLIFGKLEGVEIMLLQGRLHFYEGYEMSEITFPIRIMKEIGIKYLFLTNAAGSLNKDFVPGDIVLLKDHINFMGTNPLIGKHNEELGDRFPSMHEPYDADLRIMASKILESNNVPFKAGVYAAVSGPTLETRAESLMLAKLGADLVGMSTVPETIVAVQSGMSVMAVSVVTNLSNIFHKESHSQKDIEKNALRAKENLQNLIINVIKKIN